MDNGGPVVEYDRRSKKRPHYFVVRQIIYDYGGDSSYDRQKKQDPRQQIIRLRTSEQVRIRPFGSDPVMFGQNRMA